MIDNSYPSDFSVLIEGTEIAPYILAGSSLEWSLRDLDKPEPIVQIGELNLGQITSPVYPELDLDPTTSPILAAGSRVQVYWGGTLRVTARIRAVEITTFLPCTLTPSEVRVLLTDKLDQALRVESKEIPPIVGAVPTPLPGGGTVWIAPWTTRVAQLITAVLDAEDTPYFVDGDLLDSGIDINLVETDADGNPVVDGYSAPQQGGSLVSEAARIAALRGYYLFCDENEQVQFVRNPDSLEYPGAAIQLDCSSCDATPTASLQEPASSVEVSSTTLEVVINLVEWPKTIRTDGPLPSGSTVIVDGEELPLVAGTQAEIEREIRFQPTSNSSEWSQRLRFYKRKYLVNSDLNDTGIALVGDTTLRKEFSGRYLKRSRQTSIESRTVIDTEVFPDDFGLVYGRNWVIDYELETRTVAGESKTYFSRSTERTLTRKYDPDTLATNLLEERLITRWEQLGRNAWRGTKQRFVSLGLVTGTLEYGLIPDPNFRTTEEYAESPPEPPVREPDEEVRVSSGSSLLKYASFGKPKYLFLPGLTNQVALERYAQNNVLAEQQYRIQIEVARQLYPADTVMPLQREDVHQYALIRDGVRVEFLDRGIRYVYTGYPILKLANPVEPVYPPPYDFTVPPGALTIGPYSIVEADPFAQAPPVPLAAYGGSPPYTFSVVLPPGPGVYIAGGYLIVSGLARGTYAFVLRVTDAALAVADTAINVVIAEAPASIIYALPPVPIEGKTGTYDEVFTIGQAITFDDRTGTYDEVLSVIVYELEDRTGVRDGVRTLLLEDRTGVYDLARSDTPLADLTGLYDEVSSVIEACLDVFAGTDDVLAGTDDVKVDTGVKDVFAGTDDVLAGTDDVIQGTCL